MELNVEKTKMIRFKKGGGKKSKVGWWWKGKRVKKVKEYTYLGYIHIIWDIGCKWRSGSTSEGEGEEWSSGDGNGMEYWKEEIW